VTGRLDLGAAEVAELLSVPKTWVLESARNGALPCVRLGPRRQVRP
jgi:excisionase family DNA binding protein